MKGEGIFLTLLLLIAGSTRAITRKCIVGTTPEEITSRLDYWTMLPSELFFELFELLCLNIFDFSSLAST